MSPVRRWIVAWLPVLAWAAVIFVLSSIPGTQLPSVDLPQADKLAHTVVYAVLGALMLRALEAPRSPEAPGSGASSSGPGQSRAHPRLVLLAVALTTLYGVSDEIHQRWTPNRCSDWHDVVADAIGGTLGTLALIAAQWLKIRRCFMMGPGDD